jgi:hypothetical protein
MGVGRVFAPGHFDLELEGVSAGPLSNLQGGEAVAEVIEEKAGADHFTHKHVGNVHYNDIVLTFGGGMSKGFYDWIEQATLQNFSQKAGAVITSDPQGKAQRRLEWHGGLLTEIDFPKLDAASKDPFRMTVKITPEHTKSAAGSGNASVVKGQKY